MPEFNVLHIVIVGAMTAVGAIIGWVLRSNRSKAEKRAVNAGWQEQLNAKRKEHDRLTEQNKGLMEQISQYQASNMDAKNRARELSEVVKEAFARRDELRREIKDIRANLELSISEREQLQSNITAKAMDTELLKEKDASIAKLRHELKNWQGRVTPLIEKFRQRNEEVARLEAELDDARVRIAELEASGESDHTRIEPVSDPDALTDGRDASNEAIDDDDLIDPAIMQADDDDDDQEIVEDRQINGARDRLQAIKGVGPAIEKTLNEMGIFRFQQIAEMSEYDIDRVAKRLKGFRSRIYREDWIGQARELRDQEASG